MTPCLYCNKLFNTAQKQTGRQKYCSARCREKFWISKNPERDAFLKKKSRLKKGVQCRCCLNNIPVELRKSGRTYCSDFCRKITRNKKSKDKRTDSLKQFKKFKTDNGCNRCGYNKCAASLDFHHVDPKKKQFRITHCMWSSNSDYFKREFEKCVLLCKNCHGEVHDELRNKPN